jgi:PAS domain S-box-containing protein
VGASGGRPRGAARCDLVCADGWIRLDLHGRVVAYNEEFLWLWRLTDEESAAVRAADPDRRRALLMQLTLARVRDPETVAGGMRRQLALPGVVTFEDVALVDGRILERYGVPLLDPDGVVEGRAVSVRDVTSRRQADAELRERARQQEAIAELGESAINGSDPEALLQQALRATKRTVSADTVHLLALSRDGATLTLRAGEAPGRDHGPERVDAAASPAAVAAFRGGTVVVTDMSQERRLSPGGHARCCAAGVSTVVRGRTGTFGVLCAHWSRPRSVSEDEVHFVETVANVLAGALARHDAEREVLERERELRAVFDASQDGLLTFDDAGVVVDANPAAGRVFQRDPRELVGQVVYSLFGEGTLEHCRARLGALVTTGRCSGEQEVRLDGTAPRIVEYNAVARILPGRNLVVLRDVTEQRQLQARLALADRMASVGTLAAGVAHELNNPLAYVSSNLTYVADALRQVQGGAASASADTVARVLAAPVQEAIEGACRMRSIVHDLRTFSRAEDDAAGPVDLRRVLESSVRMAWNEIKYRGQLEQRMEDDLPPVHGSEARLGQVFLNLLVNAAQALPEGAAEKNAIRLVARRVDGGGVVVEVTDTGCGIPPEHRRRIFDPFFTTKPVGLGTGLGLSICHNIVTSMGGEIVVESAVGQGTTFRVHLPAAGARAPGAPARA